MLDRRQVARNLIAIAISSCGSSTASVRAFCMEDNLRQEFDKQFYQIVRNVAAIRASNLSVAIVVTPLFKDLIGKHSLPVFRAYMAGQYKMTRVKDAVGNIEYYELNETT